MVVTLLALISNKTISSTPGGGLLLLSVAKVSFYKSVQKVVDKHKIASGCGQPLPAHLRAAAAHVHYSSNSCSRQRNTNSAHRTGYSHSLDSQPTKCHSIVTFEKESVCSSRQNKPRDKILNLNFFSPPPSFSPYNINYNYATKQEPERPLFSIV